MKDIVINKTNYQCKVLSNGVITELWLKNLKQNIIPTHNGWGCELGNWYDYFSQLKHLKQDTLIKNNNQELEFEFEVHLPKNSNYFVKEMIIFKEDSIVQNFNFRVTSTSAELGDLVNRFAIRGDLFHTTIINKKRISHRSTNIYYQYPLQKIKLITNNAKIEVENNKITIPPELENSFQNIIYVRDEPTINKLHPSWVIHTRLLSDINKSNNYIIRWFYPNFVLPKIFNLLAKNKSIRNLFWRWRERWPRAPFNISNNIKVYKDQTFIITSKLSL